MWWSANVKPLFPCKQDWDNMSYYENEKCDYFMDIKITASTIIDTLTRYD